MDITNAEYNLVPIVSRLKDMELELYVMEDALKVDGVRIMCSAEELQQYADELGLMLLTPKVSDLINQQAVVRVEPVIKVDGNVTALAKPERYSELVDKEIAGRKGLVDSVGKPWSLVNALQGLIVQGLPGACNYGWHTPSAPYAGVTPGLKVWQPASTKHNFKHKDPSQVVRLMSQMGTLRRGGTEEMVDISYVANEPSLAPFISHEGVLRVLRQPGVPLPNPPDGVLVMPAIVVTGH